jgi:hypothetical protein
MQCIPAGLRAASRGQSFEAEGLTVMLLMMVVVMMVVVVTMVVVML